MSAYLAAVLADLPVYYWRLADPGGGVLASVGSNRARLYIAAGSPVLGYSGPVSDGGSCFFPGSAYFKSADTPTLTPPFTIEMWMFQAAKPTADSWATSLANFKLGDQATTAFLGATITGFALVSATAVPSASWHHCVFTATTTVMTLFLDGVQVATVGHAVGAQTAALFVGSDGTNGMQGWVSEVAFYNYVLGTPHIVAHAAAADQPTLGPSFKAGGIFDPATGSSVFPIDLLQKLIDYVSKTYQNAP